MLAYKISRKVICLVAVMAFLFIYQEVISGSESRSKNTAVNKTGQNEKNYECDKALKVTQEEKKEGLCYWYEKGNKYFGDEMYYAAANSYEKAIKIRADDCFLLAKTASAYYYDGSYKDALNVIYELKKSNESKSNENEKRCYYRAKAMIAYINNKLGRDKETIEDYENTEKEEKSEENIKEYYLYLMNVIYGYYEIGDTYNAKKLATNMFISSNSGSAKSDEISNIYKETEYADILLKTGKIIDAQKTIARIKKDNFSKKRRDHTHILMKSSVDGTAGQIEYRLGRKEKALKLLEDATLADPEENINRKWIGSEEVWENRGFILLEEREYEKAEEVFASGTILFPKDPYLFLGKSYTLFYEHENRFGNATGTVEYKEDLSRLIQLVAKQKNQFSREIVTETSDTSGTSFYKDQYVPIKQKLAQAEFARFLAILYYKKNDYIKSKFYALEYLNAADALKIEKVSPEYEQMLLITKNIWLGYYKPTLAEYLLMPPPHVFSIYRQIGWWSVFILIVLFVLSNFLLWFIHHKTIDDSKSNVKGGILSLTTIGTVILVICFFVFPLKNISANTGIVTMGFSFSQDNPITISDIKPCLFKKQ